MNALTEPVIKQPRHLLSGHSAKELLDALASGTCDQDEFFLAVSDMLHRAPDTGWEILALVDQYYRRGKITSETFGSVKTHLQDLLLGKGRAENGVPKKPMAGFSADPRPAGAPNPTAAPKRAPASGAPLQGFGVTQAIASASPAASAPASSASPAASSAASASSAVSSASLRSTGLGRTSAIPITKPSRLADPAFVTRPASIPLAGEDASDESLDEPSGATDRMPVEGDLLRGRYLVKGVLGQGGMGTVFEAIDQFRVDRSTGDQRVAIKVLHTAVIRRPQLFAELRREFQHLQSLSHANIVRVHEFDRDGDLAFFTMEYLSGALLARVVSNRETPLMRPYALAIVRDVGAAIVHAHSRGVVHGDLNPGNIFITDNGEVRVLDFGASHQLHHGPWISDFEAPQHVAVATPSYASCQLLAGETADARDDIYALACVAYVLLAGSHPFDDQTALRARTLRLTPRRPSGLTRRQWQALKAGLHFERERRPSNAREWLERLDLHDAASHLPALPALYKSQRQRSGRAAWVVAALLLGVVVTAWWAVMVAEPLSGVRDRLAGVWESWVGKRDARDGDSRLANDAAGVDAAPPAASVGRSTSPEPTSASDSARFDPTRPGASPASPTRGELPAASAGRAGTTPAAALTSPAAPAVTSPSPAAAPSAGGSSGAANGPAAAHLAAVKPAAAAAAGTVATPIPASATAGNVTPFRARIELTTDAIEVTPGDSVARLTVRRSRLMRGDADFSWWTESGTAKPGRDFVPVKSHVETLAGGKTSATLEIPLLADPAQRESRSFYVVIDAANEDAAVGPRTLTMITIPGPD